MPSTPQTKRIASIRSQLSRVLLRDQKALLQRLSRAEQEVREGRPAGRLDRRLAALERSVGQSLAAVARRLARRPRPTFPEDLPISARRREIIHAIERHPVVIISGETGSGKSTQLPKMCLEAGRGIRGKIGCTQPRRIAATTIARRIAAELGEEIGQSVGYKIRFRDRTDPDGFVKVMTDGMLLAETQQDPRLTEYDTLIIDEAHERSLNIDFLLGIMRTLLGARPELRLLISSATLETEKFSAAFGNAPVLEVSGRMYPVRTEYMPVDPGRQESGEKTYVDAAVEAVDRLRAEGRLADVLIFMPTEQDIRETCERLEGRAHPGVSILPLFARLPRAQQDRVYSVTGTKIVVATNVAETSLTIPGIRYVIDTGMARLSRYLPKSRTTSLPVGPISRSSADQRKGRCGRVQEGVCIRLYSEADYDARPAFTTPEILRANLAEVILRMVSLKLGHPSSFPFLDRPSARSVKDGFDLLLELGAIRRQDGDYGLTEKGRIMARMPLDPKISRMMIEAGKEGCVKEMAVIAAALSIQDPRERPFEQAAQADQVQAPFQHPESDFITLLNIWDRYHGSWAALKSQNKMRKFCREHFLSFPRMREWMYIHEQITSILREQRVPLGARTPAPVNETLYDGIHRSVLSGCLSNIAVKKEKNIYLAARGREVMVFPGSALFNRGPAWIVAAEMVKTSRLFARTAARIDPRWLEALGGALCRSSYGEPHWEKGRGEVRAFEQVTLFGLVIVSRRAVSYGPIDPALTHEIFVQSALVEGEVKDRLPFLLHNQALVKKLTSMEDRLRRRGILVDDAVLADFYSRRLEGVCDLGTLKGLIKARGGDGFLRMREEDLVVSTPDPGELALYPDRLTIGDTALECTYRFDPGKAEDGVTVRVPSGMVSWIPAAGLDWGVPGLLKEKVETLIKGLPKRYRKQLVPVSGTVEVIVKEMERTDRPLLASLAAFVYRRFGVDIPAAVWSEVEIPEYLRMRIAVTDHQGREVASGRDIRLLRASRPDTPEALETRSWKRTQAQWERTGLRRWDFDDLPESIPLDGRLSAYPALVPAEEGGVKIRLLQDAAEARDIHRKGVEALLSLHLTRDLKFLRRSLTLPQEGIGGAGFLGGAGEIEKAMYRMLLRELLQRDIRGREAFEAHARRAAATMLDEGRQIKERVGKVLAAYGDAVTALLLMERAALSKGDTPAICAQIREQIEALVPQDFLEIYRPEDLLHLPRYLKAAQIRAERAANDPAKDRSRMERVRVFAEAYGTMRADLSPHASPEKREALETYRWMVEEFKVSVFAQELKTRYPVSEKRLDERRREIERML